MNESTPGRERPLQVSIPERTKGRTARGVAPRMTRGGKSPPPGSARDCSRATAPGCRSWAAALGTPGIPRRAWPRGTARKSATLLTLERQKRRKPRPLSPESSKPRPSARPPGWAQRVPASWGRAEAGRPGRALQEEGLLRPPGEGRPAAQAQQPRPSSRPGSPHRSPRAEPAPGVPRGRLLHYHAPALSPIRTQPQPAPWAEGPMPASACLRQGYEVHREEDERATVEERENEHHRLHPPPPSRPPPLPRLSFRQTRSGAQKQPGLAPPRP